MPKASVIIPVYNGSSFIIRAMDSALAQTLGDIEVIVVDDASTDSTTEIVSRRAATDSRLRLIRASFNRGPSASRNAGIAAARGRWIAVLDADDWYRPTRLKDLIAAADEAGADIACDDLTIYDETLRTATGTMFGLSGLKGQISAERFVLGNLPDPQNPRRSFGFLKPVIRSSFLAEHGLRYNETMSFAEDYAFYLDCLLAGACWITVPISAYFYSVRSNSLTANHSAGDLFKLCAVDECALERSRATRDRKLEQALRLHLVSTQKRASWAQFIDAFKERQIGVLIRTATLNVPVFQHVTGQCLNQAYLRSSRIFKR